MVNQESCWILNLEPCGTHWDSPLNPAPTIQKVKCWGTPPTLMSSQWCGQPGQMLHFEFVFFRFCINCALCQSPEKVKHLSEHTNKNVTAWTWSTRTVVGFWIGSLWHTLGFTTEPSPNKLKQFLGTPTSWQKWQCGQPEQLWICHWGFCGFRRAFALNWALEKLKKIWDTPIIQTVIHNMWIPKAFNAQKISELSAAPMDCAVFDQGDTLHKNRWPMNTFDIDGAQFMGDHKSWVVQDLGLMKKCPDSDETWCQCLDP